MVAAFHIFPGISGKRKAPYSACKHDVERSCAIICSFKTIQLNRVVQDYSFTNTYGSYSIKSFALMDTDLTCLSPMSNLVGNTP